MTYENLQCIGISIEEGERNKSETIMDDFTDIQMTIDDYIIKTLDINEECDGEEFFELVHECHYGNKNIEDVIASVEEFIEKNRELLRRMKDFDEGKNIHEHDLIDL